MEQLGLSSEDIYQGDAAKFTDTDSYNYFYMYNSFNGDTFRAVIHELEQSWKRKPRVITFLYCNAVGHEDVIAHGIFKLSKVVRADEYAHAVNVYRTKSH